MEAAASSGRQSVGFSGIKPRIVLLPSFHLSALSGWLPDHPEQAAFLRKIVGKICSKITIFTSHLAPYFAAPRSAYAPPKLEREVIEMNKILTLVTAAVLAVPVAAFAAPGDGPVKGDRSFTISGSGTSDDNFDDTAYGVTGELGYFLTDAWQAGLRQSFNGVARDEGSNDWAGSTRGFIQYNFNQGSNYRPYLGVNLGGIYGEAVSDTGTAGVELGLKLYVLKKTYITFGAEYSFLFEDENDINNSIDDGVYLYNVGVGFNW
jgi:hypothetical protein